MTTLQKRRQVRREYDAARLAELGREMAAQGHLGLKVEKDRLAVDSLSFLQAFKHLEALDIYGIARGIEVLAELRELREVAICGVSLRDLSFLERLPRLEWLWLQGVRLKSWSSVGALKRVKSLTMFNTRLDNFDFLAEMESLQIIRFDRCSQLASLPDLSRLSHLRRVIFDTTNRLADLTGVAKAPNLEDVVVMIANNLPPEAFDCLVGHPKLKAIYPGIDLLGSPRHRAAVARIPQHLLMSGFLGTPNAEFVLR